MNRNTFVIICILILFANTVIGQSVGINNPVPNASSALDITSTNRGLLIPRMTTAQRIAISTPATGLLVYDTTLNLFYYFDGTAWRPFMIGNLDWLLAGNAGTTPATNFIGTTDAQPLVFRTNNVEAMRIFSAGSLGIGTTISTASALVEMLSTNRGFLMPRMTTVQRNAIATPATGLIVYDTTLNLFYYFDGIVWRPLVNTSGWDLPGNAGTNPATQFVGTTDAQPLVFRTNNVEAMRIFSAGNLGIGTTVSTASSLVEMLSTTKGFLMPRMTSAQRNAIATPATGLIVYDTSLNLFYYFDGIVWRPLVNTSGWDLPGNTGTNPATQFIGTTDAQPLVFRTNNVEAMRIFSAGNLGIGTTVSTPSSLVEMLSTTKGFLMPRMTTAQRNAIVAPATGLIVYDTTLNLFYYFDGTVWRPLINTSGWDLPGNAGTNPANQYVGTTDAQPLVLRTNNTEVMRLATTGNVGIGTTAPSISSVLELTSTSRGILIPRMTSAQRIAIAAPATGLLVYDNTLKLFYYWDGIQWVPLQSNLGWLLTGNLGTSPSTNYLGTGDAQHFVVKTNNIEAIRVLSTNQNVGIGQLVPASKFAVNGNTSIGAGYSAIGAPVNGAIIQGHTAVGSSGPLAIDVLSSYAISSEVAVAGYSTGTNFAGYFQNTSTGTAGRFYKVTGSGGSALQAFTNSAGNNANVVEIAGNGTGNSLNISDTGTVGKSININKISATTTGSAIEIANAGKGIGVYVKNTNATNTNPGIKVEQTKGDGTYIQMQAGNTGNGLYIYQNGTGLGQRLDMAATNPGIGFQMNHAGTERGFDINLTNAGNAADAIKIIHSGTGKGINVNVASTGSYAIWATNSNTVPAVSPSYVVTIPTSYTTNFAPGVAVIAAGGGHGIIANSVLDALATTDHDGGIFIVRQDNLTSTNVAAASVGARINNTTYKIIGLGAVSTLVKDLNDDMRVMACPESPEVLFQDFGRGKLVNGTTHIMLDPIFSKNIKVDATHPLNTFIQLRGDCKGVYVTNETPTGFDVVELNGGKSNTEFTYFISASRANETLGNQVSEYENMRFKRIDNPMFNQREK